ncbi:PD40 domain-containing protein [Leptolyngbya sp. FACHB-671]|uniref:nSTAND1 domain-containing NTPase n=1 Tax=Leptolyngbya sp. FACHB-671 TaxID=2692812 RepID=UPI001687D4C7|nr:PD40 domain-containing protein [Leptolyngbya sp. FACHB-671]MBD2068244.1 PD40 domain-containing protein [Leptolyngbya sp. FACHB-671]
MTKPLSDSVTAQNNESLRMLARSLTLSQGQFSLILALCNYRSLQHTLTLQLQEQYHAKLEEISLAPTAIAFEVASPEETAAESLPALITFGLETLYDLDALLVSINQTRDEFRKNFSFPLVLWVTNPVLQRLIRVAPDFYSWAAVPIEFEIPNEELVRFIKHTSDKAFEIILEVGAGIFLDTNALDLGTESPLRAELEFTRYELQKRGVELEPEIEASLEFLLARDADSSMEQSRQHYERSLELWQQLQNLERQGCVLYSLGLWWRTYAVECRSEAEESRIRAKAYFQQCTERFEQAGRNDLCAKFINALGVSLQDLHQWEELEIVARKALDLHRTYSEPFRLARAYGLLAELALSKADWNEAERTAQQAISILDHAALTDSTSFLPEKNNLSQVRAYHQGWHRSWYLFSLARAISSLNRKQAAIEALETAMKVSKDYYDPELYIQILEKLRSLYFEQGDYLNAFENKQRKRSIEQQYGFSAFIGADRLSPRRRIANPVSSLGRSQREIPQEIVISGRQQNIEGLVERISRNDHKLTVIYGQSGVGKSSLLQAGLILALEQVKISTRNVLPLLLRVYSSWIESVGQALTGGLKEVKSIEVETPLDSISCILEQLQKNAGYNLVTVLILDQFEEFFFTCTEFKQRLEFYDFLQKCLEIPYVKVVLSLREDYVHYLLECNRLVNMEVINKNILDKNILYYLGNFSQDEAKVVIQNLTEQTRLHLEQPLINQLVNDLTTDKGEVRPIELQVVGAQIQTEKITTLQQYQRSGSKETLVERYLEEVVKECGPENQTIAQVVLYLLTDENNTRPLKTRPELEVDLKGLTSELESEAEKLDLILKIFVRSGLVVLLPEIPANRYQLIHDYLVSFIRQKQGAELVEKLRVSEEKRKQSETKLKRFLIQALIGSIMAGLGFASLAIVAVKSARQAQINEISSITATTDAYLSSNQMLDALIEAIRARRKLQEVTWVSSDLQTRTQENLEKAVYQVVEYNRLQGYSNAVWSVAFSPDGQTLVSSGNDKIKLWNREGKEERVLEGHQGSIWSIAFSPDGQTIASAGEDKTVRLWRTVDGQSLKTIEQQAPATVVTFSPDGRTVASAGQDRTVRLWRLDGTLLKTLEGHTGTIQSVIFDPDGRTLVSAGDDETIKLWKLDGTLLKTWKAHDGSIWSVSFSSDGQTLASAGQDRTIKVWSRNGRLLNSWEAHEERISSVSFSPDGQTLVSASIDRTIRVWSREGKLIATLIGHKDGIRRAVFSSDGKTIASASEDTSIRFWRIDNGLFKFLTGHRQKVLAVDFSPDSQFIASSSEDGTIKLWDRQGKLMRSFNSGGGLRITFSPDGKIIASAHNENVVKLWDLDGKLIKTLRGHQGPVWGVAFSPDGEMIASSSEDQTIRFWKRDGTFLRTLKGHTGHIREVTFSPDGQTLASASLDNTVRLWRRDGTPITTLRGHDGVVLGIAFSPDGKTIASASADNTINLWKLDGTLINTLFGHKHWVMGVVFSPDGKTLVSSGWDHTVKLWSLDGTLLKTLTKHTQGVRESAFSLDGETIASASDDNTIILWNKDQLSLDVLDYACSWVSDYLRNNPKTSESDRNLCNK